jgi:hypothetical protein
MPMHILGKKKILYGFGKNNFEHAFLEKRKKKVNNAFCGSLELTLHPPPPHWDSREVAIIAVLADRE